MIKIGFIVWILCAVFMTAMDVCEEAYGLKMKLWTYTVYIASKVFVIGVLVIAAVSGILLIALS